MKTLGTYILVFILCVAALVCTSQNYSGICTLGDIKAGTNLSGRDTILLDCSHVNEKKIRPHSDKLNTFKCFVLEGNPRNGEWEQLFEDIKNLQSAKSIVFCANNFTALPYGVEKLSNSLENLSICYNDKIDYYLVAEQLPELPNIRELSLDVNSVFDLPEGVFFQENITKLALMSRVVKNTSGNIKPAVYDFYVAGNRNSVLSVKYVSFAGTIDNGEYDELHKYFSLLNKKPDTGVVQNSQALPETLYTPEYRYVKPPIQGLDVVRELNTINPAVENVLTYPSGTRILVPQNAFMDANGKPVSGNVTFSYREFRDPVDFLVSGIPMKYDSGGTVSNFESAGMFELYASAGNEPLKLMPGKQIKMDFVATSEDSTYNFYSYNDSTGNWEYKGKPQAQRKDEKIKAKVLSDAYMQYRWLLQSRPLRKDSTGLNLRFESFDYLYTCRLDTNYRNKVFRYGEGGKHHSRRLTNLVRIVRVRKNKQGEIVFKVKFDSEAHPEMQVFNNLYFLLADNVSINEFKKEFCNKKFYNDIRVYRSGDGIELKLKGIKIFKSINAELVTMNDKGEIKAAKDARNRMKQYDAQLKRKARDFKRGRRDVYCYEPPVFITDPLELSMYAFNETKKYMSKEESKMDYNTWICYFNQVMENERLAVSNAEVSQENLVRSLQLDNMGIFNCDQIQRLQNPVEIFASYNKLNNGKLSPESIYIIDKKINAVLQYNGYRGYGPDKIAFSNNPDAQNVLLAINKDGTMAIYRPENFKENTFTDKTKFTFRVEELGNKYANVGELKKSIGL
jgi:hypothetical protein